MKLKARYTYLPHRSTLEEAWKDRQEYETIDGLFDGIPFKSDGAFSKDDLLLKSYAYNSLFKKRSYLLVTKVYRWEKYPYGAAIGHVFIND